MTAERIQCWGLKRSAYDYSVKWRRSSENNADFLSRYPEASQMKNLREEPNAFIFKVESLNIPISSIQVAKLTSRDSILSRVIELTVNSWPSSLLPEDSNLQTFFSRRNELSVMSGVLMWGIRVVVPEGLRIKLIHELHIGHLGMSKMKSIARPKMWWPNIDQDIESTRKACEACMVIGNDPKAATVHPWLPTSRPYQRVHIDYAGPVEGDNMLLVIVNSYSKWPEVCITNPQHLSAQLTC